MSPAIHPSARLGAGTTYGEGCVIGAGVAIGSGCVLGHHVVIHPDTVIGNDVRIDDQAALGKLPMRAANSATTREQTLPPLTVTQQQVFHFARRERDDGSLWPIALHDDVPAIYALPGGRDGGLPGNMKLGEHDPGRISTADGRDGVVDPGARQRMIDHVRDWWPGLEPSPTAEFSCLYTWTEDRDFVIDRAGPLVVLSPCSGHGAKFAPLIGEWAADIVEGGCLPYPHFSLARRGLA